MVDGSFCPLPQQLRAWHIDAAQEPSTASVLRGWAFRPGWNSERFDGRNLALRLVALGHTDVTWYRSGREAWEVAGLPEAPLDVQDW